MGKIFGHSVFPLFLAAVISVPALGSDIPAEALSLNGEGVKVLNKGQFALGIQKFEAALKICPTFDAARSNLAIAHNNWGLKVRPKEALVHFHQSLFIDPKNLVTVQNLGELLRVMKKNPRSFGDRVGLGNDAFAKDDFVGAVVEYRAALKLRKDPQIQKKLDDTLRRLEQKAI